MKRCVIFAGGDFSPCCVDVELTKNAFVIAADKGYEYAKKTGIKIDLLIGDLDSCHLDGNEKNHLKIKTFPPEKDDTDLMLAIKEGFKAGCTEFILYGALGGRFDHTLGAVQSLAYILSHGGHGQIIAEGEYITLLGKGEYSFKKINGRYFSLLSYSEKVEGLTVTGTKYTLCGGVITNSFPIGLSNEIKDAHAVVKFSKGCLLVIYSQKN